jgi:hypothetical protein
MGGTVMGGMTKARSDTTTAIGNMVSGGTTTATDGTMKRHNDDDGQHDDAAQDR